MSELGRGGLALSVLYGDLLIAVLHMLQIPAAAWLNLGSSLETKTEEHEAAVFHGPHNMAWFQQITIQKALSTSFHDMMAFLTTTSLLDSPGELRLIVRVH